MNIGKFEKLLVEPYLPNKIVPPDYIKEILREANTDFPMTDFEYSVPHTMTADEYRKRYEELESQMVEILTWRIRWFGRQNIQEKEPKK